MNNFNSTKEHRLWLETQSTPPLGFSFGKTTFRFTPMELAKEFSMNLSLIALEKPTKSFAGVFTRNAFPGAPVIVGRSRLKEESLGAIVINNKISNVCAPGGVEDAEAICSALSKHLSLSPKQVIPSSTGVIGWKLPVHPIVEHLGELCKSLQSDSIRPLAEGIMTTDLYPKVRREVVGKGSIVGVAKGAGMIEPNLATMLVYILTDIEVAPEELREILNEAIKESFNSISIDSDQSTSDTVLAVSSNQVPSIDKAAFRSAFQKVCKDLAQDVVRNGEGVKHVIKVTCKGAPTIEIAKGVSKSIVNSPLVQTAICGNDPNVGRVLMAIGKYLGNFHPEVSTNSCEVTIGGVKIFEKGSFSLNTEKEQALAKHLKQAELYQTKAPDEKGRYHPAVDYPPHERCVEIEVALSAGQAHATVWGSDRTLEYISENADYRS